MERKKVFILIFALVVLVGGIFLVARNISNKSKTTDSSLPSQQTPSTNAKKEPANLFGQDTPNSKTTAADVTGTVDTIVEKTLTIKTQKDSVAVNINGATPVMLQVGNTPAKVGQLADLKKEDSVKITYDSVTLNAQLILIVRAQEKK